MNKITDNIYLGSLVDCIEVLNAKETPITHIVTILDFESFAAADWLSNAKIERFYIDQADEQDIPDEYISTFLDWMKGITANSNNRILIHCLMGISRSPTFVLMWLLEKGMTIQEAVQLVRRERSFIQPHFRLVNSAYNYDTKYNKNWKIGSWK